jgi:hypothetical protein
MLLSACLDIVKTREKSSVETYRKIFEEARSGLSKTSSTDVVLGSLLAFGAMLQNQQIVRLIPCCASSCLIPDSQWQNTTNRYANLHRSTEIARKSLYEKQSSL